MSSPTLLPGALGGSQGQEFDRTCDLKQAPCVQNWACSTQKHPKTIHNVNFNAENDDNVFGQTHFYNTALKRPLHTQGGTRPLKCRRNVARMWPLDKHCPKTPPPNYVCLSYCCLFVAGSCGVMESSECHTSKVSHIWNPPAQPLTCNCSASSRLAWKRILSHLCLLEKR